MIEARQRQIKLVHELMYQITVREAMTTNVVSFPPSATFREIQRMMKERRFSGTPIVENDALIGIISIDDIISAFDHGYIDKSVADYMTQTVVSVPQSYSVIAAANIFQRFRYGRLPVVASPNSTRLVGILTYGDILSRLVLVVNSIAERFEEKENRFVPGQRLSCQALRFDIAPDDFEKAGTASTTIKRQLKSLGIPPAIVRRIAVICYEAEMNVVIHSLGGTIEVEVRPDAVQIQITDEGPGIPNVEQAMVTGYTTANEKIRALGFGAGMGLSNMKRCADTFQIRSSTENGTEILATVRLETPNGEPDATFPPERPTVTP